MEQILALLTDQDKEFLRWFPVDGTPKAGYLPMHNHRKLYRFYRGDAPRGWKLTLLGQRLVAKLID